MRSINSPEVSVNLHCSKLDLQFDVRSIDREDLALQLGFAAVAFISVQQAREIADRLIQAVYDYELRTGNKVEYMPTQKEETA